ncbi:MAG TPA: sigma-54-dependent Fis family transcriptional regulator [Bacteroidales bacterium]|nr:sigma-54-dependent Fis family transcriptional regulator [Bacteroidales bacterium]
MENVKGKLLIIDDNEEILLAIKLSLQSLFDTIMTEKNPANVLSLISDKNFDVIILDMNFETGINTGNEGLYWLSRILEIDADVSVILITAYADIELAVKGIQQGAADFIEKPWDDSKLYASALKAKNLRKSKVEATNLRSKNSSLKQHISSNPVNIVFESPAMAKVMELVNKVSETDANVLILGENGTGKELIAREIHNRSKRKNEAFIAVDLGAINPNLFESELFGHVKGAFTDARDNKIGRFELANGGTLFLDEIGNLPMPNQAKLLSTLQNRRVTRVGSSAEIEIDIRLISATNASIHQVVSKGLFREDLLYRINTIQVEVPPLRNRREDIIPLINHFIDINGKKYNKVNLKLSPNAEKKLYQHPWPGNIRQLEHAVEKAVILASSKVLQIDDFMSVSENLQQQQEVLSLNLIENEKMVITKAIERNMGNMTKAARDLGVTRKTLYNKIERYGLQ